MRAALPTLTALLDAGARVIVTAHLGRPKGAPEDKYSLAPVAARLGELLGKPVALAKDTVGESARETVAALGDDEPAGRRRQAEVALVEAVRLGHGAAGDLGFEGRPELPGNLVEALPALGGDGELAGRDRAVGLVEVGEPLG